MDRQSFENLMEQGAFAPSATFAPQWEDPIPFSEIEPPRFQLTAYPAQWRHLWRSWRNRRRPRLKWVEQ